MSQQYARVFRNDEALKPTLYLEKNWMAEEFSGGCYVGVSPPDYSNCRACSSDKRPGVVQRCGWLSSLCS